MAECDEEWITERLEALDASLQDEPSSRREAIMAEVRLEIGRVRQESFDPDALKSRVQEITSPSRARPIPEDERLLQSGRITFWEWATPCGLLFGGFVLGIGWMLGVIFLWSSEKWTRSDKVMGTLVWPFGYFGATVVYGLAGSVMAGRAPTHPMGTLVAVVVAILAPMYVLVRLYKRLRQWRVVKSSTAID